MPELPEAERARQQVERVLAEVEIGRAVAEEPLAERPGPEVERPAQQALLLRAVAEPRHVVRMTWYITDKAAYLAVRKEIGQAWREVMGRHFPAMAVVVVSALIEDRAKVEIEATAVVSAASADGSVQPGPT